VRHGLCLANVGTYSDPRTVVALAEEAERAGWEALLVWDTPALRRAARHDGWAADTTNPQGMTLSPEDVARSVEIIRGLRTSEQPFDVVVLGHVDSGDRDTPAAYANAGATWWLENVHDLRGDLDEMLALVRAGPSR
jgi:hypothetical protein